MASATMQNESDLKCLLNSGKKKPDKVCGNLTKYNLEFAMMFAFLGWNLQGQIVPNILLRNSCLARGFNSSICSNLNENDYTKNIEEQIQPQVVKMILTKTLLERIIPAILSHFLGPWSDRFGRKKVICATLTGASLSAVLFVVVSVVNECLITLNPWIYVLPNLPLVLSGGWPSMFNAVLCQITDSSDETDRSSRLIFYKSFIFSVALVGTISCTFILQLTNEITMFVFSAVLINLTLVLIMTTVRESLPQPEKSSVKNQILSVFSFQPLSEMLITAFKPRLNNGRKILWCLLTILILSAIASNGMENIFYLLTRKKFQWTLRQFTFYFSCMMLFRIIGNFIGVTVLKKLMNFSDFTLVFIAIISNIFDTLSKTFAETTLQMYITSAFFLLKVLGPITCQSIISTTVSSKEIGRIFCLMGSIEAIASSLSSPIYTFVYSKTFTFFPSASFLISVFIALVNLTIALYVKNIKSLQ